MQNKTKKKLKRKGKWKCFSCWDNSAKFTVSLSWHVTPPHTQPMFKLPLFTFPKDSRATSYTAWLGHRTHKHDCWPWTLKKQISKASDLGLIWDISNRALIKHYKNDL